MKSERLMMKVAAVCDLQDVLPALWVVFEGIVHV